MSNRRPLHWSRVLADLKSDRLQRAEIREEFQRTPGLRGGSSLSSWRGQSGSRYVVRVHAIDAFGPADALNTVVLFIRRSTEGRAQIVMGGRDLDTRSLAGLLDLAKADACQEVHVHRLEEEPAGRAAILQDLRASAPIAEIA
jgi:hypothetical protein